MLSTFKSNQAHTPSKEGCRSFKNKILLRSTLFHMSYTLAYKPVLISLSLTLFHTHTALTKHFPANSIQVK